jgi:hypothetical protein
MGGTYQAVQVRGEDRDAIRALLEQGAAECQPLWFGPPLNGWIGIYPAANASRVARYLARRWPAEILATAVFDDDIFAYEYFRDGKRADRYNSAPDYFKEVSEEERRALRGRPRRLAHLATDAARFDALADRLARQDEEREVFASRLLQEFTEVLGIRNGLTTYDYLQDPRERRETESWDQFLHLPDQSAERARLRETEAAFRQGIERLKREGPLLAECGGTYPAEGSRSPMGPWPRVCPSPDGRGFWVAWSDHAAPPAPRSLECYGPPWTPGAAVTGLAIPASVFGLALSPSGRYLAVAHAAGDWKAVLWDLRDNRLVAEAPQVRAVERVGFLPDESAMFSVSSNGDDGKLILTPVGPGDARVIPIARARLAAAHPGGGWLVASGEADRFHLVDVATDKVARTRNLCEGVYDMGFTPAGDRLCLATRWGLDIYSWDDLLHADGDPQLLAISSPGDRTQYLSPRDATVYKIAFDAERNRLLAGMSGSVHFLDLDSGESGVLLRLPLQTPVPDMALSRDRTALAVVTNAPVFAPDRGRPGPLVQFWDYRALGVTGD